MHSARLRSYHRSPIPHWICNPILERIQFHLEGSHTSELRDFEFSLALGGESVYKMDSRFLDTDESLFLHFTHNSNPSGLVRGNSSRAKVFFLGDHCPGI
jgi:hypothetical protein